MPPFDASPHSEGAFAPSDTTLQGRRGYAPSGPPPGTEGLWPLRATPGYAQSEGMIFRSCPRFLVWGYSSIVVTTAVMPMRTSSLGVKST